MGIFGRTIFLEITSSALLGTILFTFVLFLQRVSRLFELLVRSSAPGPTVGSLFGLILPPVLTFTIPVGVLVGVLVALSRMSSDAEITAMRAAGLPSRKVAYPVFTFAVLAMLATAASSLWLTPHSVRQTYRILNKLAAAQLTAEIQPRVFEEQFPNTILYVGDVVPGPVVRWRNLFLADITPADERRPGAHDSGDGALITVASEAIATPDVARNRIQLSLVNGSTHQAGKQSTEYYSTSFPASQQILEAVKHGAIRPRIVYTEMDTLPLWRAAKESVEARIELHQRLALPPACLLLALIGIPLGVSSRKGGKSSAFVLTVIVAFLYYMGLISLIGLARQGTLPVAFAVWLPNVVFGLVGLILLVRLERPGDRDIIASAGSILQSVWARIRGSFPSAPAPAAGGPANRLFFLLPQLIDTYILTNFLFYLFLLLASFVMMANVYNFFELLSDIVRNRIPMGVVGRYLFFLTPQLVYLTTPVSVLVAVLVTFGVLSKNNEVTAFKACGVSLYRLAIPVLLASAVLSVLLFAFDHYLLPHANLIQDALRNQIKGRPVQTYLRPDRKWIFGQGSRIFYYKYLEQADGVMVGPQVYELDPTTFQLKKHISAERARWEPALQTWVFQNGWAREIGSQLNLHSFQGKTATFPELQEPPGYFMKEAYQDKQMNFVQLARYIDELRQSGFDTVRLQVQFHKKFAVPLFALIMAMISVPFAFLVGARGAMAAVGVSFGIAIAYFSVSQLFEQIGNVNQLPAVLAAWSPDAVFSLAGLYLLARMRT
ncbi:MAG TPA: LptF/LptG family permease [Bryobacteraceae bacterium]|nr:LptF/LptG family permease [Bryobacteraceae bacterium]